MSSSSRSPSPLTSLSHDSDSDDNPTQDDCISNKDSSLADSSNQRLKSREQRPSLASLKSRTNNGIRIGNSPSKPPAKKLKLEVVMTVPRRRTSTTTQRTACSSGRSNHKDKSKLVSEELSNASAVSNQSIKGPAPIASVPTIPPTRQILGLRRDPTKQDHSISGRTRDLSLPGDISPAQLTLRQTVDNGFATNSPQPSKRPRVDEQVEISLDNNQTSGPNSVSPAADINPSVSAPQSLPIIHESRSAVAGYVGSRPAGPIIYVHVRGDVFEFQKSKLAQQSAWFSQRLNASGDDKTIRFTLDHLNPLDFRNLVIALDRAFELMLHPPQTLDLLSIFRASNSLEFTAVNAFIINRLEDCWTSDCSLVTETRLSHAVEVISLARQSNIPKLLPRAFYEVIRDDADVSERNLSNQDCMIALKMQTSLRKEWMLFVKTPPHTTCDQNQAGSCSPRSDRREKWTLNVIDSSVYDAGMQDPLFALRRLMDLDWTQQGYCSPCANHWYTSLVEKRMTWWDLLSSYIS
ncbi:hypothetical protein QCA50_014742 [Cerrena zonata]|uniref:BTB domain-containing protein n=1 Tax=Cerrena zonata TaxID=2478898 RepID=A0AAW0FL48_9APHY